MHRVVLVGCGLMADGWLEAIQSTPRLKASVSVVGLVDLDVNRAKDLAGRFGRTLGRQHAGRRYDRAERSRLVERSRRTAQRRAAP